MLTDLLKFLEYSSLPPALFPCAGNSPVQIHKRQFAGIVDRWFNLSIAIKQVGGACRGGRRPVACAVQACMHANNGPAGQGGLGQAPRCCSCCYRVRRPCGICFLPAHAQDKEADKEFGWVQEM